MLSLTIYFSVQSFKKNIQKTMETTVRWWWCWSDIDGITICTCQAMKSIYTCKCILIGYNQSSDLNYALKNMVSSPNTVNYELKTLNMLYETIEFVFQIVYSLFIAFYDAYDTLLIFFL